MKQVHIILYVDNVKKFEHRSCHCRWRAWCGPTRNDSVLEKDSYKGRQKGIDSFIYMKRVYQVNFLTSAPVGGTNLRQI